MLQWTSQNLYRALMLLAFSFSCHFGWGEPDLSVDSLQQRWDQAQFVLKGDKQVDVFKALLADSETLTEQQPNSADAWIWNGIIHSSYAGIKGGLGALSLVKQAKAAFQKALEIDPKAMNGSALTSLGSLYYQVPGWPLGFGNDKRAEEYLQRGLEVAPEDIDANYFYADFLAEQGRTQQAQTYAQRAVEAPPRPGREIADTGRREQARALLQRLQH